MPSGRHCFTVVTPALCRDLRRFSTLVFFFLFFLTVSPVWGCSKAFPRAGFQHLLGLKDGLDPYVGREVVTGFHENRH